MNGRTAHTTITIEIGIDPTGDPHNDDTPEQYLDSFVVTVQQPHQLPWVFARSIDREQPLHRVAQAAVQQALTSYAIATLGLVPEKG